MTAYPQNRLSPREQQVVDLVMQGKENREIATVLVLSTRTVEAYMASILYKRRVRSRTELVLLVSRERQGTHAAHA